jgi:hypothetical protein
MLDDIQITELKAFWLAEAYAEAQEQNPLRGYCERVYIVRTACKRRHGPHKGKRRKYSSHEVELLRFLPSRRCVQVRDLRTPGLDALAEEIFSGMDVPPHTTPAQLFPDYFRKL